MAPAGSACAATPCLHWRERARPVQPRPRARRCPGRRLRRRRCRHDVHHDRDDVARTRRVRRLPAPGPGVRSSPCPRRASACPRSSSAAAARPASCSPTRARARVRLAALRAHRRGLRRALARLRLRAPPAARTRCSPRRAGCAPTAPARGARRRLDRRPRRGHRRRARRPAPVDAVVSLSGERILGAQRDLLIDARGCASRRCGSAPRTTATRTSQTETRQLYRGARGHARPDRLLVVGGADHGIDLLTGTQARARRARGHALHPSRLIALRRPTRPDS